MNLVPTYEFEFLAGFTSHLPQMLAALRSTIPAKMEFLRTDSAQLPMEGHDLHADVLLALEVNFGERDSVMWRAATIELGQTAENGQYAVRLALYKGGDILTNEAMEYENVFMCQSKVPVKDAMWKEEPSAQSVGRVFATAVYEFIARSTTPDRNILQDALAQC